MTISIDFRLTGSGWARCSVICDGHATELTASYLSDALGNLVLAAFAVLTGAHSIAICFDEEPGEYRWSLLRSDNETLLVKVLEFSELWGCRPDSEGSLLVAHSCEPLDFAQAVMDAAEKVLTTHGIEGYRKMWVGHEFPSRQVELLREEMARWCH